MNSKIAKEIQTEQRHGRQKYGRGPNDFNHDDAHTGDEWQQFIQDHAERLFHATPMEYRQRLVNIAGLAVSAIEAHDRQKATAEAMKGEG